MPNTDAHMPPQPIPKEDDPVWANTWNPETNEWAPSSEQHSVFGVAEPSHGDEPHAAPSSEEYGRPDPDGGTIPDARMNLLDAVQGTTAALPAPPVTVRHIVETQEQSSPLARGRVVRVQGGAPTVLLEENPNRARAILKAITTSGIVLLYPARQGGVQPQTGVPVGTMAGYPLATGDPPHVVESGSAVEAFAANTGVTAFTDVAVWEELDQPGSAPGLV